jgi:hypothetical protein
MLIYSETSTGTVGCQNVVRYIEAGIYFKGSFCVSIIVYKQNIITVVQFSRELQWLIKQYYRTRILLQVPLIGNFQLIISVAVNITALPRHVTV